MENRAISHEHISASSEKSGKSTAKQARLNFQKTSAKEGSWTADIHDKDPWLQITLDGRGANITRIATQGKNGENEWVTEYNLLYFDDMLGNNLFYKEQGKDEIKVSLL